MNNIPAVFMDSVFSFLYRHSLCVLEHLSGRFGKLGKEYHDHAWDLILNETESFSVVHCDRETKYDLPGVEEFYRQNAKHIMRVNMSVTCLPVIAITVHGQYYPQLHAAYRHPEAVSLSNAEYRKNLRMITSILKVKESQLLELGVYEAIRHVFATALMVSDASDLYVQLAHFNETIYSHLTFDKPCQFIGAEARIYTPLNEDEFGILNFLEVVFEDWRLSDEPFVAKAVMGHNKGKLPDYLNVTAEDSQWESVALYNSLYDTLLLTGFFFVAPCYVRTFRLAHPKALGRKAYFCVFRHLTWEEIGQKPLDLSCSELPGWVPDQLAIDTMQFYAVLFD